MFVVCVAGVRMKREASGGEVVSLSDSVELMDVAQLKKELDSVNQEVVTLRNSQFDEPIDEDRLTVISLADSFELMDDDELIDDSELFLADAVCEVLQGTDDTDWESVAPGQVSSEVIVNDTKMEKVAERLSDNAKDWELKSHSHNKLAFLIDRKIVLKRLQGTVFQIFVNDDEESKPKACIDFDPGIRGRDKFKLHKNMYAQRRGQGVVEPYTVLWNQDKGMGAIITAPFGRSFADVSSELV